MIHIPTTCIVPWAVPQWEFWSGCLYLLQRQHDVLSYESRIIQGTTNTIPSSWKTWEALSAGKRLVKTKHGQSSMPYVFTPLPSLSLRFKICFMGETEAILHVSMDQIFLVLWSAGTGKGETGNISAQLTCSVPPKHRVPSSATSKLVD